jgi:iron-sulfur cluster assembly protein
MITIKEQAAKKISQNLEKRGRGIGIRIGVKTTGCSGLAYVLEYVDELDSYDNVFESGGVQVVVDNKSLTYIDGLVVDYTRQGLNEGFEFSNPNSKGECGCGESFRV